jgi:nucleoside-diphosphate-sugar epimerase
MTPPIPKNQLILISGVNGFIASQTAKAFLNAGYSVRGTVRSKSSAEGLLRVLQHYVEADRLEVVEVNDITQPGAFDTAVQGPLPSLEAL